MRKDFYIAFKSLDELRAIAKACGVEGYSEMKKVDLVAALRKIKGLKG